jgi:serine protease
VIGVAALNRDGFKATYSSFGAKVAIATVGGDPADLGAWGPWLGDDGLLTTDNDGLFGPGDGVYGMVAGTSFAAPVVSGIASLMLSVNPALSADQLVDGLQRSARPHVVSPKIPACTSQNNGRCICSASTCGTGIADATQALLYARSPQAYVAPARAAEVIDNADVDAALSVGLDRPAAVVSSGGGSSGGGALGAGWLVTLAAATLALRRTRRRPT